MANRYGQAALLAARMNTYGKAITPAERWDDAVRQVYPTSAGQKKAGPRATFAGLCEAGLVKDVSAVLSAGNSQAKDQAVEAVRLLRAGTHTTVTQLWSAVSDPGKPHHAQMDVVLALWKNGLIVT